MSAAKSIPFKLIQEGEQAMRLCNACRYCEGFCAVFPAMERRVAFLEKDLNYLANLCHDCGECFYSCQYAPPHEFALNLPHTFAAIRAETYRKYAWPRLFSGLFRQSGLALLVAAVAAPALFLLLTLLLIPPSRLFAAHTAAEGSFYQIISQSMMTLIFSTVSLGIVAAFGMGFAAFSRDTGEAAGSFFKPAALGQAIRDTLQLRYLDGGGEGCAYPDEVASQSRRWFHHLTFYGFSLCFAATTVAAIYHYAFGWDAPYPFWSAPPLLGALGGLGLLIGPVGLLWLKGKRDPQLTDRKQTVMDVSFLVLLFLTSLTGLLLLILREKSAMAVLLAVHLGVVMGLFLTMPYGKFVHAIYRFAALVQNAAERRRPIPRLGPD